MQRPAGSRGGTKTVPQRSSKSRASLRGSNCRRNFLETGRLSRDRCGTNYANRQIYRQSYHGNVQRTENSSVEERKLETCKGPVCGVRDHCHGEAGADSCQQSHDERFLLEPASVQAEKERGQ